MAAPVVQLDRIPDFGSGGWGFESSRVYKNRPFFKNGRFFHDEAQILMNQMESPKRKVEGKIHSLNSPHYSLALPSTRPGVQGAPAASKALSNCLMSFASISFNASKIGLNSSEAISKAFC